MTGIPFATVTWYVSAGATAAGSLMVWSCNGLILLSSLFSVAGIFAAARYQNRSYEESMKMVKPFDLARVERTLNRIQAQQEPRTPEKEERNLTRIKTIEPYGRWTYIVTFKDMDRDALITQEKYEEIKKRFG